MSDISELREQHRKLIQPLRNVEREHVLYALNVCSGNKYNAAYALGITVKTLYNKLHAWGLAAEHITNQRSRHGKAGRSEKPKVTALEVCEAGAQTSG